MVFGYPGVVWRLLPAHVLRLVVAHEFLGVLAHRRACRHFRKVAMIFAWWDSEQHARWSSISDLNGDMAPSRRVLHKEIRLRGSLYDTCLLRKGCVKAAHFSFCARHALLRSRALQ